jgi:putative hydrolase of the HAD superfamily
VVLWDFDGTLAWRPGLWAACALEVLDEHLPAHGVSLEQMRLELNSRFPWHEPERAHAELDRPEAWWQHVDGLVAEAMVRAGVPSERAPALARGVHERFIDATRGWELFADTIPALRALAESGWRNAVLSNHVPELEQIADGLGISRHVERIISSALIGYEKPHPEAFRYALRACGDPEEVWMVGDNVEADVRGAEALGLKAILVRRPGDCRHRADDAAGAARMILATI